MLRRSLATSSVLLTLFAVPPAAQAQMDARDMEICRQQCMSSARDADDPRYKSCVRTRCMGQPAVRRTAPAPKQSTSAAAPATPPGTWALGSSEALGVSVHVQTDEGVIGIACAPEGVAIRATNGLFRAPALGWITDTGSAGGTIQLSPGAIYSEATGPACALGVPGLAAATALVLVDAPVVPKGRGQGYGLTLPVGEVPVASGAEAQARYPGARNVPVPGLAAGLGALAASCPPLAEALRQPCP